jgi:hypothetical protein
MGMTLWGSIKLKQSNYKTQILNPVVGNLQGCKKVQKSLKNPNHPFV